MSSLYKRGKSLWVAFKDERGIRVCRPTGYKIGEEAAARALLAELDRKASGGRSEPGSPDVERAMPAASKPVTLAASSAPTRQRLAAHELAPLVEPSNATGAIALTVREYGEMWLTTRESIETYADECGRLRNHVFPRIGDMRMRDVRPRHIRDCILDLKKSNVHRRGTGQGLGASKIAPRTVRHVYSLMRRMFSTAVIDEVIDASPVIVAKGVLPKNVDKDPAWRATALYDRAELVRLVSDPIIPPERRILNAIKGLAGTRHGEAAGLRWNHYSPDVTPLGKLVVARSYDKDGTKTKVARLVPVHPSLARLLDEWKRSGWAAVHGRPPSRADYVVPRTVGEDPDGDADAEMWQADQANKLFLEDLEALGMRRRRGHDLRRTFITLAQEDGAQRDVLQVITHAPNAADVMGLYTTYPWSALCAEVAKLQITLPEPQPAQAIAMRPNAVAASSAMPPQRGFVGLLSEAVATMKPEAGSRAVERPPVEPSRTHAAVATARPVDPVDLELRAVEPGLVEVPVMEKSRAVERPMEPRNVAARVLAETHGAANYFGAATVALPGACSATVPATCSADSPVISSRWPGMIRRPTVYETVALPLSYSGGEGYWYPRRVNRASTDGREPDAPGTTDPSKMAAGGAAVTSGRSS